MAADDSEGVKGILMNEGRHVERFMVGLGLLGATTIVVALTALAVDALKWWSLAFPGSFFLAYIIGWVVKR